MLLQVSIGNQALLLTRAFVLLRLKRCNSSMHKPLKPSFKLRGPCEGQVFIGSLTSECRLQSSYAVIDDTLIRFASIDDSPIISVVDDAYHETTQPLSNG